MLPTPVFLPRESLLTEEPGGLQSMGSQRVRHNLVTEHSTAQRFKRAPFSDDRNVEIETWF